MKIRKEVSEGQILHPFYGSAYYDHYRRVAVCYPIPLNWIIAFTRNIYWRFMIAPDLKHKELSSRYGDGYTEGYLRGYEIREKEVHIEKLIRRERGQSLVELALSITLLLILLSGLVEFGLIFFQFVQLRDAAQEGALYGSVNPNVTDDDIALRAKGASNSPINLMNDPNLEVLISYVDDNGLPSVCEGDGLKVAMNYSHKIFMPFLGRFLGRNFVVISAEVTDTLLVRPC